MCSSELQIIHEATVLVINKIGGVVHGTRAVDRPQKLVPPLLTPLHSPKEMQNDQRAPYRRRINYVTRTIVGGGGGMVKPNVTSPHF